jgi:putative pyruvate formate lyase activating enzyme
MRNSHLEELRNCVACPRECGVDRFSGKSGYCRSGATYTISSIVAHLGEEPVLSGEKGICNIFFSNCNLACIFCQNHQISQRNSGEQKREYSLNQIIEEVGRILDTGIKLVGFVSASHFIPQLKEIISAIRESGRNPVFVYNSNGYDKVESLRSLEGFIDVFLPDFKYMDRELGEHLSDAPDYPEVAGLALKEMYRQKGSRLELDENGLAESGMIIRHLILPTQLENSLKVLEYIAYEISTMLHISLMSQYNPNEKVMEHNFLGRTITMDEYSIVTEKLKELGMYNGWIQELASADHYNPDFRKDKPFS